jgi:hypothetical protein
MVGEWARPGLVKVMANPLGLYHFMMGIPLLTILYSPMKMD